MNRTDIEELKKEHCKWMLESEYKQSKLNANDLLEIQFQTFSREFNKVIFDLVKIMPKEHVIDSYKLTEELSNVINGKSVDVGVLSLVHLLLETIRTTTTETEREELQ